MVLIYDIQYATLYIGETVQTCIFLWKLELIFRKVEILIIFHNIFQKKMYEFEWTINIRLFSLWQICTSHQSHIKHVSIKFGSVSRYASFRHVYGTNVYLLNSFYMHEHIYCRSKCSRSESRWISSLFFLRYREK